MSDARLWRRARDLFDQAMELEAAERAAWLAERCAGDRTLRDAVDRLLAADTGTGELPDVAGALRDALDEGRLGSRLGRWRLLDRLGSGGMGTIFLAERDGEIRQKVALKLLHTDISNHLAVDRFRLEKQLLAALDHPQIARLLDDGVTAGGQPYLVMEWVDGERITDYCDRHRLDIDHRLELVRKIADALQYAHRNLVVHRDIKPSNILVTSGGIPKLLDFGIAKALEGSPFDGEVPDTTTHARPLSPGYASPEQLAGEAVTTASDIYSLGVLTFELLTGQPPFRWSGRSIEQMQALYDRSAPPALCSVVQQNPDGEAVAAARRTRVANLRRQLSGDLDLVIAKALHHRAEARYEGVAQFAEDLRRSRHSWPLLARPSTAGYRARKFIRRNRLATAAVAVATASVLALTVALGFQTRRVAEERDLAVAEGRRASHVTGFLVDVFRRVDPLHAGGSPGTPQDMLFAGARRVPEEFGDDPATQATLLDAIAQALQNLGALGEAAPLFRQALELRQDLVATDGSPEQQAALADSLDAVGEILRLRGEFQRAESFSRAALERRRQLFGERHATVAESLANLAEALHEQGRYDEAEPLYTQALEIRRELFGELDLRVAQSLDQRALLWLNRGYDEKALRSYRQSLDIRRDLLPADHPRLAQSHYHLGTAEQRLERYDDAEQNFRQALDLYRRAYGEEHPALAQCLHDLGVLIWDRGRLQEAEPILRQALQLRRKIYPDNHPDLVQSLGTLGGLTANLHRLDAAQVLLDEALERSRQLFGDRHLYVAITLGHLADVHSRRDQPETAARLTREAVAILERSLGAGDSETWRARSRLAGFQWRAGDQVGGLELMRRAHQGLLETLGADHPTTTKIDGWLAANDPEREAG